MNIPTMLDMQSLTNVPIGADAAIRALVLKALYTAAVSGTTVTASISGTGPTGQQKEQFFRELQANGFTVTNSGSTFTVAWA